MDLIWDLIGDLIWGLIGDLIWGLIGDLIWDLIWDSTHRLGGGGAPTWVVPCFYASRSSKPAALQSPQDGDGEDGDLGVG